MEGKRHIGDGREQDAQADGVFHRKTHQMADMPEGIGNDESIFLPLRPVNRTYFALVVTLFQNVRKRVAMRIACTIISVYARF